MPGEDEIHEMAIRSSDMATNAIQVPTDLARPALSEAQAIGAASIPPCPHLSSATYLTDAIYFSQGRCKS